MAPYVFGLPIFGEEFWYIVKMLSTGECGSWICYLQYIKEQLHDTGLRVTTFSVILDILIFLKGFRYNRSNFWELMSLRWAPAITYA